MTKEERANKFKEEHPTFCNESPQPSRLSPEQKERKRLRAIEYRKENREQVRAKESKYRKGNKKFLEWRKNYYYTILKGK